MVKYKRILLKLSGESLMGSQKYGIDTNILMEYAKQIKEVVSLGVEVGIVIGGGNIFRGLAGSRKGYDRVRGDQMGMMATVINSLAMQSVMENLGMKARVMTAIGMEPIGELYSSEKGLQSLLSGETVIFSGGTGNPFFTTDTAASLRAVEIKAEALLKGTRVDGVYSADPEKHPDAIRFNSISYNEVINKELHVMDLTAFTMCRENDLPVIVFNMNKKGNLKKIILGEKVGTLVKK